MADILGSISNFFTGGSGGSSGFGNVLGGLATAATIYNAYQQNKQTQSANQFNQTLAQQKFAEDQRQFDLSHELALARLEQGAGGAGGPDPRIAKSQAIQGAYNSMIRAVQEGRAGEATMLSRLIDQIQRVNASVAG